MPHFKVNPIYAAMFADGFSIAEHHRLAWEEEAQRVRAIRGEVLSAMFEVEAKIDYAIGDLILPYKRTFRSPAWLEERHLLIQNAVLTHFDLRTKIEVLRSLIEARFPKMQRRVAQLCSKLDAVRDVRNK